MRYKIETAADGEVAVVEKPKQRRRRRKGPKGRTGRPRTNPIHPEKAWYVLTVRELGGKAELVYDEGYKTVDEATDVAEGYLSSSGETTVHIVETIKIGSRSAVKFENVR